MKVALIGATGRGGSSILQELAARGHDVTAIARNIDGITAQAGVTAKKGDVADGEGLTALLRGHDAAITAIQFLPTDMAKLLDSFKASGTPRLLVMGGAASLETADGSKLIDSPHFPPEYAPEANAAIAFLKVLKQEPDLDWTFLSPAALIEQGERTGTFRIGGDKLLTDAEGNSRITFQDYAIAIVDELEKNEHSRKRFSVAY